MTDRIPRLAFDMDGVVANFADRFLQLVNRQFRTVLRMEDWTDYGGVESPAVFTQEQWEWGMKAALATPYFWSALDPIGNPEDLLWLNRQMEELSFNGYFVTRRHDTTSPGCFNDAQCQSRMWLENQGVHAYTSVVCSTSPRVSLLESFDVDAYLDDWGEQFLACRKAGINAYLVDRSYNQHIDAGKYRVHDFVEFVSRNLPLGPIVTSPMMVFPQKLILQEAL